MIAAASCLRKTEFVELPMPLSAREEQALFVTQPKIATTEAVGETKES